MTDYYITQLTISAFNNESISQQMQESPVFPMHQLILSILATIYWFPIILPFKKHMLIMQRGKDCYWLFPAEEMAGWNAVAAVAFPFSMYLISRWQNICLSKNNCWHWHHNQWFRLLEYVILKLHNPVAKEPVLSCRQQRIKPPKIIYLYFSTLKSLQL